MNRHQNWPIAIFFPIGLTCALLFPTALYMRGDEIGLVTFSFIPGAFVAVMARLHLFSEVSLGPLKARMREEIKEAEHVKEEIRSLAVALATSHVFQIADARGRVWMTDTRPEGLTEEAVFERILDTLRSIGIADEEIHNLRKLFTPRTIQGEDG